MTPKDLEQHIKDNYLTITQFAKRTGLFRMEIYRLMASGLLPAITPFRGNTLVEKKYVRKYKKVKKLPVANSNN